VSDFHRVLVGTLSNRSCRDPRSYSASIPLVFLNQLYFEEVGGVNCLAASCFSIDPSERSILPSRANALLWISAPMVTNPDRIHTAGSTVGVGNDSICFRSFFFSLSNGCNSFLEGRIISRPYTKMGITYCLVHHSYGKSFDTKFQIRLALICKPMCSSLNQTNMTIRRLASLVCDFQVLNTKFTWGPGMISRYIKHLNHPPVHLAALFWQHFP
jgi:hypothetical protein